MQKYSTFNCHSDQPPIDWDDLLSLIQKAFEIGELGLIVGSGVSQIAPANVPAGENIVKYLIERLFFTYPNELHDLSKKIERSIDGIPFEVLMARMSEIDAELAQEIIVILTHIEQSNVLHLQIRRLMDAAAERGFTLPVVTSNYDMGISGIQPNEDGLFPIHHIPNIIITEEQINRTANTGEIFHIHGANTTPMSLVFDYKQEFKLEQWKHKHLQSIMQNKLILVLGFSGKDLDICKALTNCKLQGIIWFRAREESCNPKTWTIDAQKLVKDIPLSYAVNTYGQLQYALTGLLHDDATTLPDIKLDNQTIKSRFDKIQSAYPTQFRLWARWMGLRAGFWQLAKDLTDEEQHLLSEQQILEVKAFGHYYAGQHLSGAQLLHKAGQAAIRTEKPVKRLERYIYFCNTEVEYLNRGAFTLRALATSLRISLTVLWRLVVHHDKMTPEARDEYKNLLGSSITVWPLFPIFLCSNMLGTWPGRLAGPILQWLLRLMANADLDKFINISTFLPTPDSPEFDEAQERYRWLGQQARQINLYRFSALRQFHLFYAQPYNEKNANLDQLAEIYRVADLSVSWAQNIGDPCRTAKGKLICLEVMKAMIAYNPDLNFIRNLPDESHIRAADGSISISSMDAWAELSAGEISPWCLLPIRILYRYLENGTRMFHKRIRLLALTFLETE